MKRLIRLAIIAVLGVSGTTFYARASLSACLHSMGLGSNGTTDEITGGANSTYDSVLFTEWLAGDVFSLSKLPMWSSSEGNTVETMRAYAELHEARQDSDSLIDESKRSAKHLQAKEHVFEQLVAREIHLLEAATSWLELDQKFGHNKQELIARIYPGKTLTERYCRRLIWELELTAKNERARIEPALNRARAEFRLLTEPTLFLTAN